MPPPRGRRRTRPAERDATAPRQPGGNRQVRHTVPDEVEAQPRQRPGQHVVTDPTARDPADQRSREEQQQSRPHVGTSIGREIDKCRRQHDQPERDQGASPRRAQCPQGKPSEEQDGSELRENLQPEKGFVAGRYSREKPGGPGEERRMLRDHRTRRAVVCSVAELVLDRILHLSGVGELAGSQRKEPDVALHAIVPLKAPDTQDRTHEEQACDTRN